MSDYLEAHPDYRRFLEGLRWSASRDALEDEDGRTLALAAEVHAFVEGFRAQRPLIHFGHLLHFLYLLRRSETPPGRHHFTALAQAWREAGRPAWTAGVFAAVLCADVPSLPRPPSEEELSAWQRGWSTPEAIEQAPLAPEVFENCLACALSGYRYQELLHWFRFGTAPIEEPGDTIAQEVLQRKPRSLEGVLAELSRHDRLAGAIPYVTRLVAALSVPPRRLFNHELPMGGYSDVAARGHPEALLPSQFALDELEFLRRHAQNELLYYRREEPARQTREEWLLVLDQGVRTWGRVRLVLAACVFALGRLASQRRVPLLLATTSNDGRVTDLTQTDLASLASLLSTSDLGANPGLALERALAEPHERPREVILLTHPRNLGEADVAAAARRVARGDRLFAVTVDAHGEVTFQEVRHGAAVCLGRWYIEPLQTPAPRAEPASSWSGDCEPIGFPFRFGVGGATEPPVFGFDQEGERLMLAWQHGMLLVVRTDGSSHELVPRARVAGRVLSDIHQVLGVVGGFVAAGAAPGRLVAVHYDFTARQVRRYEFPCSYAELAGGFAWRYLASHHHLLLRLGDQLHAINLSTGANDTALPESLHWHTEEPTRHGAVYHHPLPDNALDKGSELRFDAERGVVTLDSGIGPGWERVPTREGVPALRRRKLVRALLQGDVLAVLFTGNSTNKELWLFTRSGDVMATIPLPYDRDRFALSADGRLLAVQRGPCQLEVRTSGFGGSTRCLTPVGRYHNNASVELGEQWLALIIDRTAHLLHWGSGELVRHVIFQPAGEELRAEVARLGLPPRSTRARQGRLPGFLNHDPARFRLAAWSNLIAVIDLYGEVFLFEQTGELVCAFFAFRQLLAAWLPDGTCLGPESLLGRRETPDAARRIGQALGQAWERGERTVS